MQQVL